MRPSTNCSPASLPLGRVAPPPLLRLPACKLLASNAPTWRDGGFVREHEVAVRALLSQDSLLRIQGGLLADHSSTSAAGSRAFGRRTTVLDGDRAAPCSSTSRGRLPPRVDGACCCRHGPHKKNASLVTCEAGNIVLPSPATSARLICIFHTSMPHLERCCCRRPRHTLCAPSPSSQPQLS